MLIIYMSVIESGLIDLTESKKDTEKDLIHRSKSNHSRGFGSSRSRQLPRPESSWGLLLRRSFASRLRRGPRSGSWPSHVALPYLDV